MSSATEYFIKKADVDEYVHIDMVNKVISWGPLLGATLFHSKEAAMEFTEEMFDQVGAFPMRLISIFETDRKSWL